MWIIHIDNAVMHINLYNKTNQRCICSGLPSLLMWSAPGAFKKLCGRLRGFCLSTICTIIRSHCFCTVAHFIFSSQAKTSQSTSQTVKQEIVLGGKK